MTNDTATTIVLEIDSNDAHIWDMAKSEILDAGRRVQTNGVPIAADSRTL